MPYSRDEMIEKLLTADMNIGDDDDHYQWAAAILDAIEPMIRGDATAPGDGWRPIETALKDGTTILLINALGRITMSSWGVCRPQGDGYRANGGEPCWRTEDHEKIVPRPTHWMPLPAAPVRP